MGVSLVSYMLNFWNTLINLIMKWYFDKIILLKLDLVAPLMTDPVSVNSTNLHYMPIMESTSININPSDTYLKNYGQHNLWMYVQLKDHPPLDKIHLFSIPHIKLL